MMTEFLLSLLNIRMLAIVILFCLILFLAYKEFFKKPTSKDLEKKEKENIKKTNSEAKEISESEKFLELIDSLPMRNAEKESGENLPNSKFLQETFDREFLKNNDTHDSIVLSDEILELAQEAAEKKLGRKVASLIKRVDKKGHIILDMAAINFITGKHSPIIMPDGTIRVLDFLTMEEAIELALTEERPLYVVNKEKQIRRISKEELENIVIEEEQLMLQQKISLSNFKIKELQTEKDDLQKENQELASKLAQEKDEAKKYKNQAEILIKLHESKNLTINIEEVEELAKKRNVEQLLEDALEKVAETKKDFEKKENQTNLNISETENEKKNDLEDDTAEFVKEFIEINKIDLPKNFQNQPSIKKEFKSVDKDLLVVDFEEETEEELQVKIEDDENDIKPILNNENELKLEILEKTNINDVLNGTENSASDEVEIIPFIENLNEDKNLIVNDNKKEILTIDVVNEVVSSETKESVQKKKLTEKEIEKVSKDFFKFEKYINAVQHQKDTKDRVFISYILEKFSNSYMLNFNFNILKDELKIYLNSNNYSFTENEIKRIFEVGKFKIIRNAFFVNKATSDIYQCDICQVHEAEDKLMGLMLCSKYTEIFTKEELQNNLKKVTNARKVRVFTKRIEDINENKFISICRKYSIGYN